MGRNEQKKETSYGGATSFVNNLVGRHLRLNTLYLFTS